MSAQNPRADELEQGEHETDTLIRQPEQAPLASGAAGLGAIVLVCWMAMSICMVLFNKWLFSTNFARPLTLVCMHMTACCVCFGALRFLLPQRALSTVMPSYGKFEITPHSYATLVLPVGLLYATSLSCGNAALVGLSVALTQVIKALNPVVVSVLTFSMGLEIASSTHVMLMVLISTGVALASIGEIRGSMFYISLQLLALVAEGGRLTWVQKVLQGGGRTSTGAPVVQLDPLYSVYLFSPICLLAVMPFAYWLEIAPHGGFPHLWANMEHVGFWVLGANCALAVMLNALVVLALKLTSAVSFVLGGVIKDFVTICLSAYIFRHSLTIAQMGGYTIAVIGIQMFRDFKMHRAVYDRHGLFSALQIRWSGVEDKL